MNNHQPHAYRQHARAHCTLSAFPHCRLCSSGDAESHNPTTPAENYAKYSTHLQQLMGTSTPLKVYEHTSFFNLWVTCTGKISISPESFLRWPAKPLGTFPPASPTNCWKATGSHQLEQVFFSLTHPPKFIETFFQLLRVHNLGVRWHSL